MHGLTRDTWKVEQGRRRTRHHPCIRLEQTALHNGGLELTPGSSSSGGRGGGRHRLGGRREDADGEEREEVDCWW